MIIQKTLTLFILFFLSFQYISADNRNYRFNHLTSEQGLPGSNIIAIHQDRYGVMWFGIESIGLCRYDGTSYQVFGANQTDSNTISNNYVTTIAEDRKGNLWVGTFNGVNKFNPITFECERFFHENEDSTSLKNNRIYSISEDQNGNMWIGTKDGISIYCPEKNLFYNFYSDQKSELPNSVLSIFKSSSGDMYIGTRHQGMYIFSSAEVANFNNQLKDNIPFNQLKVNETEHVPSSFKNNNEDVDITLIRSFDEYNSNSILFAAFENIYIYHPGTKEFEKLNLKRTLPNMPVAYERVKVDSKGNIWCGSTSNGLLIYNPQNNQLTDFYYYSNPNTPVKTNDIRDIFIDQSGLVWIGGKFEGIHIYNYQQEVFNHIQLGEEGNNDSFVLSLAIENDSTIWIGTKTGGIKKLNPKNNKIEYPKFKGVVKTITDKRIQCLTIGDNHILYAGGMNGLWEYNTQTGDSNYYKCDVINSLIKNGTSIWIGTQSGMLYFNELTKQISTVSSKYEFFSNNNNQIINNLMSGEEDDIWIATSDQGLYHYFPINDSIVTYTYSSTDSTSISGNMIRGMLVDRNGTFWVGTKANGLNKFDSKKNCFERIIDEHDISTRTIYSIIEDQNQNLWLSTHNGIIKYNIKSHTSINYGMSYGLQGKVFEINAAGKLNDGKILFGGRNGINIFYPDNITQHFYTAPIIISKFKIYDNIEDQNIIHSKHYKLNKNSNYITFDYSLLDYSDPKNNNYSYKLTPLDQKWINSGNRTFVSYTNLPGGKYTFYVKGKNSDNVFNNKELSIDFEIPTPLLEKLWFKLLLILSTCLIIAIIIIARIKSVRSRELELKKIVYEKTKALTIANTELVNHRRNLENLVRERTSDLEKAKEKAEESDRLKSAFLANMSHEIRTPLNAIMGFSSLIATEEFNKTEINEMNDIIQSNGSALLQLINDIIDISMIEADQLEINKCNFDVNDLLKNMHASFRQQILLIKNKNKIEIILDIPKSTKSELTINTDRERLKQIFNNLFSNAIKFTDSGYIKIGYSLPVEENKINFFLEDTGIGIEEKYLKEIFTRFRKIENNKKGFYRGTGLGLSICSNLVTLLDGKIIVNSKPGKGTVFNFIFPLQNGLKIESVGSKNSNLEKNNR